MQEPAFITVVSNTVQCAGHARCASVAPEIFELDDNGYNVEAVRQIPAGLTALALRAARACPERAIHVQAPAADPQEI